MRILKESEQGFGILVERDSGFVNPTITSVDSNELIENVNNTNPKIRDTFTALLQTYGKKNRNNRIYPESVLRREAKLMIEKIKAGQPLLSEKDHPQNLEISIDRVCSSITDIWWEGSSMMGNIKLFLSEGYINSGIVSTNGDLVANHMSNGAKIGISSRGAGTVIQENSTSIVQEDFSLLTFDLVLNPSNYNSWLYKDKAEYQPFIEENTKLKNNLDKFLMG